MEAFVVESHILNRRELTGPGARLYAEVEIACTQAFAPGQYLMVRTENREVRWPYPYFIHGRTDRGLLVLAASHQDLFLSTSGTAVEYWGPRGTAPLAVGERVTLVAEDATAFLLIPFLATGAYHKYCLVGGEGGTVFDAVGVSRATAEEAAHLADAEGERVVVSLNIGNLKAFYGAVPNEKKGDILVFVSNKKACGMDGCKGCYLHSKDNAFGVNVCCSGPFLPLLNIDFEADGRCFETYQ